MDPGEINMQYLVKLFIPLTILIRVFYSTGLEKQSPGSSGKPSIEDGISKIIVQLRKHISGVVKKPKILLEVELWQFSRYAMQQGQAAK
jgi:hypothetical protein